MVLTPMKGRGAVLAAGILWSLSGVFIKTFELPAMIIAFYRSLFAGLIFVPWLIAPSPQPSPTKGEGIISFKKWVAVGLYAIVVSLFVLATKLTSSANAIVLQYTSPLFVMVWAALFLKESLSRANLACLVVACSGIAVIVVGGKGTPDMGGIMVALASGLAFSGFMVLQQLLKDEPPMKFIGLCNLVTAGLLLPLVWNAWPFDSSFDFAQDMAQGRLSMSQLLGLIVMGVVQLGIPYVLFARGLQTIRAQEASLITLIEPVLNPIWVFLVLGQVPSTTTLVGGGCILLALAGRFLMR